MLYKEMTKFLNNNGITVMQPVIADTVDCQLEKDISDSEFENVCNVIYEKYLECDEEPDIWNLVGEELVSRGYKD